MLESKSSPLGSSPRAPQQLNESSSITSSPSLRSPQSRPAVEYGDTYAPAMSTIRSPHMTIGPNPIVAASSAASTSTAATTTASSSNDNHQSSNAAFAAATESEEFESLPPPPAYSTISGAAVTSSSPLAGSTVRPTYSRPSVRPNTTSPVVIAVADRFLDENSRIRHEQQQQRQSRLYPIPDEARFSSTQLNNQSIINTIRNTNGNNHNGVQIIEATPIHGHSKFDEYNTCCTKRNKRIFCVQIVLIIIVLSVLGGTVFKNFGHHDSSDNTNNNRDRSEPSTTTTTNPISPSRSIPTTTPGTNSTVTTSSPSIPSPTSSSTDPWGDCKPVGCNYFSTACDNKCKDTDPTYKSCVAACSGDFAQVFACKVDCSTSYKYPCFGTCSDLTKQCLKKCGN